MNSYKPKEQLELLEILVGPFTIHASAKFFLTDYLCNINQPSLYKCRIQKKGSSN